MKSNGATAIGGEVPTNSAAEVIDATQPFVATVKVEGVADLLFHRWNCEEVEAKGKAAKGSKAKKTDNVESYVYRNQDNEICVPGEYLRQAIIHAAKFRQDPRSPRKSAMDLFKAGVLSLTQMAPLGKTDWDYIHKCRVMIQRNAVTRCRPAFLVGWKAEFQLLCNLPEYINPEALHDVLTNAGKLIGLGDFRPTYGRFRVTSFDIGFDA